MLPPVSVGAGLVNGVSAAGKLALHPSSIIPRPGLLNVHHPPFSGIGSGPGSAGSGSALHPPFTSSAGGSGPGNGNGPASLFGPGPPGHPAFYSPHHPAAGLMAADIAARGGAHPHPALQAAAAAAAAAGLASGAGPGYNSAPHFPSPAEHALKAAQTQGLSYAEWLARTSMYMPRIPLDYPGSFPGEFFILFLFSEMYSFG